MGNLKILNNELQLSCTEALNLLANTKEMKWKTKENNGRGN